MKFVGGLVFVLLIAVSKGGRKRWGGGDADVDDEDYESDESDLPYGETN